ncbi:MAG: S-methyl-5-thioribose-1-phosphate isomerase [Spirochaetes bacterium]|nr:S-methyl-5-thioribose-1-phosphate isomerase [Spirochaetota bacterium]
MKFSKTLAFSSGELRFLDQKRLPQAEVTLKIRRWQEVVSTIQALQIRGAPAIGIAGAFGVAIAARQILGKTATPATLAAFLKASQAIHEARPTAVNLMWAVDHQFAALRKAGLLRPGPAAPIIHCLEKNAQAILEEDLSIGMRLAEAGHGLIKDGDGVLTHCNAGGLATAGMGSALSVLYRAKEAGRKFTVYVDETRPLLQGARLTTWELKRWGIPHVLICDNMAAMLMKQGRITKAITGADRIALNGDAANKIGTYGVAVLAHFHRIPFYIAAPYSTFDANTRTGAQIPIEERKPEEVLSFHGVPSAPKGTRVYNPAFDVVPAPLIRALITERGLIASPNAKKVKAFLAASAPAARHGRGARP